MTRRIAARAKSLPNMALYSSGMGAIGQLFAVSVTVRALVRRLLVCRSACRELCGCRQEPLQVQGELRAGWLGAAGQLLGVSHLVQQRVDGVALVDRILVG
jgi:hypothetical protein